MAEYALVTATMAAVLVSALAGVGSTLPATSARAGAAVTAAARTAGVPVAGARKALVSAPYRRPQLRTLYALGWIAGTKDRTTCVFATVSGGSTAQQTRAALRQVRDLPGVLRRSHLTERAALAAVDRGYRASCAP